MIPESLPCLVCAAPVVIVHSDGEFSWVENGIWMAETGNYGSAVLDDPPDAGAVFMVLCDQCLSERRDRMRALVLRGPRTGDWEWLSDTAKALAPLPPRRLSEFVAFACPTCSQSVSGYGITGAACGGHGPMVERGL